ncbi:MAG TPA: hypothetical protein VHX17_04565 [Candidatus Cybelea sp.]|jgi:hypothetical protein|nr:hypothetical protein [Candidatus Cybelea sp.]
MFVFFHALSFALMAIFGGYDGGLNSFHSAGYVQSVAPDGGGGSVPADGGGSMPGNGGG